jgi:ABC-type long-subunit fatty acid transport system fused permease/ATPase subunit
MNNHSSLFSKLSFVISILTIVIAAAVLYWALGPDPYRSKGLAGDNHFADAMYIVSVFMSLFFYSFFASLIGMLSAIAGFLKKERFRVLRIIGMMLNGIILFLCSMGLVRNLIL